MLEAVALTEPIGVGLIEELAAHRAIEDVEERGLIRLQRAGLRANLQMAHPLYGEVARSRLPASPARRLYRRMAELVEGHGARRADDPIRTSSSVLTAAPPPTRNA